MSALKDLSNDLADLVDKAINGRLSHGVQDPNTYHPVVACIKERGRISCLRHFVNEIGRQRISIGLLPGAYIQVLAHRLKGGGPSRRVIAPP